MNIEAFAATLLCSVSSYDLHAGHKLINLKGIPVKCVADLLMLHQVDGHLHWGGSFRKYDPLDPSGQ